MGTGQQIVDNGRLITIHRTFISSPTISSPSQFSVGTGVTTPTVSDTDIESVVAINGGNFKNFITGYPLLDVTNFQSTIRAILTTTEANGNNLTEFGVFNTDGTPLMFSHMVHTSITKNNSTQVTYIEKDQII